MNAAEIEEEIEAAFGALAIPEPEALILPQGPGNRASAERIRNELAGKSWQSLTPEFLKGRWSAYCYLTPEAYRYYLPALLHGVLEVLPTDEDLAHSVVWALRPCFRCLYYDGDDARLRERQALFTSEQYRAVVDFLGLAFTESPSLRYLAAQALRWGWTGIETPAHAAVREFYHRLHHYQAPPIDDPVRAQLADQIRTAFADTPHPGDHELSCCVDDEAAELAMELRGLTWQSLHPEFLFHNYAALCFLSDGGFRYFLPAFLLADLAWYEANTDPVFHLTYGLRDPEGSELNARKLAQLAKIVGPEKAEELRKSGMFTPTEERRARSIQRLAGFSHSEREAIIAYLEYQGRVEDYRPDSALWYALEHYWRPSLTGGR